MTIDTRDRWVLDRPNSYIGRSVPRPNAKRLLEGRGHFVDDIVLPRMLHVVFVRSPYAHARIVSIDAEAAQNCPGVVAIVTGKQLAEHHSPWVGVLQHLKGIVSPPQYAIAMDRACWQGEAVAAVRFERPAVLPRHVVVYPERVVSALLGVLEGFLRLVGPIVLIVIF